MYRKIYNEIFKKALIPSLLLFGVVIFFSGCEKDDDIVELMSQNEEKEETSLPTDSNALSNQWIYRVMKLYYYWAEEIPQEMGSQYGQTPDAFFNQLLYKEDRFSWISSSKASNNSKIYGNLTNKGFEYILYYADSTENEMLGEVIYTYPGSQAEKKGIFRGMFFNTVNNEKITRKNYSTLLTTSGAYYQFIKLGDGCTDTISIQVTQDNNPLNPILATSILTQGEHTIGYICYRQFINDFGDNSGIYKKELMQVFSSFREAGISDLVVDLRYNTGGDLRLSVDLGSLMVPRTSDSLQVAVKVEYNDKLNKAYKALGLVPILYFNKESPIIDPIHLLYF